MNHEYTSAPEPNDHHDIDELIRKLQEEQIDLEALDAKLDEESQRYERQVLDALHLAGLPVTALEECRELLGPDEPLQATLELLHELLENAAEHGRSDDMQGIEGLMLMGLIVQQIASNKSLYDTLPPAHAANARAEEQLYFLNDDSLSPSDREKVLRAINLLYDEDTGLDMSDPQTLIAAAKEKASADREYAINEASKVVRTGLEASMVDYMAAEGLAEHDDQEDLVAGVVVAISREYAREMSEADMDEAVNEAAKTTTDLLLDYYHGQASRMGWTDEQFNGLIVRLRRELRGEG